MQKIHPFLWFDNQAEEAMNFYVSVFKNSKIGKVNRYGDSGPSPKGSVMTASFELDCQPFTALNGDPEPAKAKRAVEAMLQMTKLDLPTLRKAHAGTPGGSA